MSFAVAADAYDRFMGRYSMLLAPGFARFAGVRPGDRILDVGCGPGALTGEIVRITGAERVAAVDPSPPFVAAARERQPGVDVRQASAEALPYRDETFDVALAQLVVHFLPDPVGGLREIARVTRPGGVVAACVWDHAGGRGPLGAFWSTARDMDPSVTDEAGLAGAREGHLETLLAEAGLEEIRGAVLAADRHHASFDEWWEPYTEGVGPAGAYVAALDEARRELLRERLRARLGAGPFVVEARSWAARGVRPGGAAARVGGA
jgi:SAM-dependent methyltransferase